MGTEDPKTWSDHYTQLREPLKAWAKDWTSLTGSARLDEERTNQTRNPDRGPKSPSPAACGCRAYSAVQATPCAMGFPDSGSFWPSSKAPETEKAASDFSWRWLPRLRENCGLVDWPLPSPRCCLPVPVREGCGTKSARVRICDYKMSTLLQIG